MPVLLDTYAQQEPDLLLIMTFDTDQCLRLGCSILLAVRAGDSSTCWLTSLLTLICSEQDWLILIQHAAQNCTLVHVGVHIISAAMLLLHFQLTINAVG